ncbi:hypothetical protein [Amycolatopsis magusensis]|uniref:Uncharacterized protein n=1 Tax=Amycolatopsis magusensis TaxID=882444 RepID=A0ABS4PVV0_9PSEU|nr:hypothetical protein [Amycolatopsis magusensis]MBP2183554.1 hypothetical protein [Amycolatopsis magusensis]
MWLYPIHDQPQSLLFPYRTGDLPGALRYPRSNSRLDRDGSRHRPRPGCSAR